jgi:hypothetical protein
MQKKKSQRTPRTTTGRVLSSNLTTPGMSLAVALRGRTEEAQQSQTHQVAVAGPATVELRVPVALSQNEQQATSQLIWVPNVNNFSLDKMLKIVLTVVLRVMTECNGAVSQEDKIQAITNIVLNLTEQNGH